MKGDGQIKQDGETAVKKKWYQKGWIVALLIFFAWPVGLYLMWKHSSWSKTTKWVISGAFILLFCVGGISSFAESEANKVKVPKLTEEEYYTEGKLFLQNNQYAEASAYLGKLESYKDAADLKQYADDMVQLSKIETKLDSEDGVSDEKLVEIVEELNTIMTNSKYANVKSLAAFHLVKAYYLQNEYLNAYNAYQTAKVSDTDYDVNLDAIKGERIFHLIRTGASYPIEDYRNVKVDIYKYGTFDITMPSDDSLKISCELSDRANNPADGWIGKKIESSTLKYIFTLDKNGISSDSATTYIQTSLKMKFFGMSVKGDINSTYNFKTSEMKSGDWEYSGALNTILDMAGDDPAFKKDYVANTFPDILNCVASCFDEYNTEITFDEIIAAFSGTAELETYSTSLDSLYTFVDTIENVEVSGESEVRDVVDAIGEEEAKEYLRDALDGQYPEYTGYDYDFYDNGEDEEWYSYQAFLLNGGATNNSMGFYKVDKYSGVVYYEDMATLELVRIYTP